MGSDTRQALIESAITLFSTKWYGMVSVAEICRSANLSNGAFYRHFKSKEEIFCAILDLVVRKIEAALEPLSKMQASARFSALIRIIFDFSQDYTPLVRVFREGQYRFFKYERALKEVYGHAFIVVLGHEPSVAEYLFAFAGLRFAAIRAALHQLPVSVEALQAIIGGGLLRSQPVNWSRIFSTSITPLPIELLPDSRDSLLAEGRKLFGEKGYFETNIHEVTFNANLAIGSFYRYFESKEAFYKEVIRAVGRDVRHFITLNLGNGLNRLERELRGLWLFILFLSMDRNCYNIVREAEFVLPNEVRDYYDAFHRGYLRREDATLNCDSTTCIEFMLGVAHYLGIEIIFDTSPETARHVIEEIGTLYMRGLLGGSCRDADIKTDQ